MSAHLADVGVGELLEVALDIAGAERRVALCEEAVDVVPVEQGAVLAVGHIVAQGAFGEEGVGRGVVGRRGKEP